MVAELVLLDAATAVATITQKWPAARNALNGELIDPWCSARTSPTARAWPPHRLLGHELAIFSDSDVKAIMHDDLAGYLGA